MFRVVDTESVGWRVAVVKVKGRWVPPPGGVQSPDGF